MVKKYILNNSGTNLDVEDIMQEGLFIFFQAVMNNKVKHGESCEYYIFKICSNLWLKELHKRKKEKVLAQGYEDIEMITNNNIENLEKKEKLEKIIEKNVQRLSPKCREVFSCLSNGLTHKEISKRMGLKSHMIVKDKIYRCKKNLLDLIHSDPEYIKYCE